MSACTAHTYPGTNDRHSGEGEYECTGTAGTGEKDMPREDGMGLGESVPSASGREKGISGNTAPRGTQNGKDKAPHHASSIDSQRETKWEGETSPRVILDCI